ncbi:MAG: ribosome biogenesis GTPase Der [Myxococcales bacterium]|nr:MAG: ribosome biogenesis GTPase Der [Myxococcales bacterium]
MADALHHLSIAIVGRPNVGKSTLFNRLVGRRQAIVDDTPGATVDRHYGRGRYDRSEYTIIDTGGFEPETEDDLKLVMREQALLAIEEADVVFVLFDGRDGLVWGDEEIAERMRQSGKPIYYLVNKVDGPKQAMHSADFYQLGVDPLYSISAEHGVGVGDLMSDVVRDHPSAPAEERVHENEIRVAVIGKPNVGKSTLVNKFLGADRHAVTDIPGTTRDAIDSFVVRGEQVFRLIDTAGIRRQKKIERVLEKRTIVKALKAMDRADVALILIDAREGVTEQDTKIAGFAHDKGLASLIVVNKWDLVEKDTNTAGHMAKEVRDRLKFIPYAEIIFISAQTGQRVETLLDKIAAAREQHVRRVGTGELNRWLERAIAANHPPTLKGRQLKIYYASQVDVSPPTIMLVVNDPDRLHFSYERYLLNRLREDYGFAGTPVKLFTRRRKKGDDPAEE